LYVEMSTDLQTRLNAHASGRRSGDQFNVHVCDRLVVPSLTPGQLRDIGRGDLFLDRMTRDYIRQKLTFRYVVCQDKPEAEALERAVRAGRVSAGRPFLNPLR
jgi:predicted GIY-YIG superfamily endonuclease